MYSENDSIKTYIIRYYLLPNLEALKQKYILVQEIVDPALRKTTTILVNTILRLHTV